jgi:gluconate 2-dehydrogenase gamma chain
MKRNLPRRRFLQVAASSAAAATVSCGRPQSPWRSLTIPEANSLGALCDQIIPPDQDPGAVQAGALDFLDRQLNGRYKRHLKLYREGIAGIDALARRAHGKAFVEITNLQQYELLKSIDTGESTPVRTFFTLLVAHTMQGFYGTPRHGGNRNGASWAMLGVPVRPVRGRQPETGS